eukprot:15469958-Alexandrium_andersonii.AAC.1
MNVGNARDLTSGARNINSETSKWVKLDAFMASLEVERWLTAVDNAPNAVECVHLASRGLDTRKRVRRMCITTHLPGTAFSLL